MKARPFKGTVRTYKFWTISPVLVFLLLGSFPASAQDREIFPGETNMEQGKKVYEKVCARCHDGGVAGAPRIGDKEAWSFRLAQGMDVLVKHGIEGFMCNRGVSPPRGGDRTLTDEEVAAAVEYLVGKSR